VLLDFAPCGDRLVSIERSISVNYKFNQYLCVIVVDPTMCITTT